VTNVLWRLPLAAKMNALKTEIRRDQRVVTGWDTENRAVVADTGDQSLGAFFYARAVSFNESADTRNQFSFG